MEENNSYQPSEHITAINARYEKVRHAQAEAEAERQQFVTDLLSTIGTANDTITEARAKLDELGWKPAVHAKPKRIVHRRTAAEIAAQAVAQDKAETEAIANVAGSLAAAAASQAQRNPGEGLRPDLAYLESSKSKALAAAQEEQEAAPGGVRAGIEPTPVHKGGRSKSK